MNEPKPVVRRPKAATDVEAHAMYIVEDSVDAALRFLACAEETINGLALFPERGAPFRTLVPELQGMRTKLVKDFPNYVVFYVDREDVIEIVRVLRGGQDMGVEVGNV